MPYLCGGRILIYLVTFTPKIMKTTHFFLVIALILCTACASKQKTSDLDSMQSSQVNQESQPTQEIDFEDYDNPISEEIIADPLEPWNRFWFSFNDVLLLKILKPVYTGYTYVTPQELRTGLSNFYYNLKMPIRVINSLLQGKVGQAGYEFGRFIVNTTVGFGGLIDAAKGKKPLYPIDGRAADFGQTLATWGIGEGIYLVWPFFGPSTARDTVGMAGDYFASPLFWATAPTGPIEFWPGLGATTMLNFNDLGSAIHAYEALTKGAIEPYVAAREAYVKFRQARVLQPALFK